MPTLYIANTSKQHFDFIYLMPESTQIRRQHIPAGGQVLIHKAGLNLDEVNSIVDQHVRYGLTRVSEIDTRRAFIGLCFDIDRPVAVEKIMYADDQNQDILEKASVEARTLSAGALHTALSRAAAGGPTTVQEVEIEVVEQNSAVEAGLNEITTVTRDPGAPVPLRSNRFGRR